MKKGLPTVLILSFLIGSTLYLLYKSIYTKESIVPEEKIVYYQVQDVKIPSTFSFCGEKVPLHDQDVLERFDRELHVNTYWHSSSILMLKRANRWLPKIEEILKKNKVPTDFKYLPIIESQLTNAISPRGATGFWQFMKPTALEVGLDVSSEIDERYDPLKSTYAACLYLKKAYKSLGNWTNVAAAYNMGVAGLKKNLQKQQVTSYYDLSINNETARYVFRILAIKEILENPQKYGFNMSEEGLYTYPALKEIKVTSSIEDLASFAKKNGANLKLLRKYNPWLRSSKVSLKKGEELVIKLPY